MVMSPWLFAHVAASVLVASNIMKPCARTSTAHDDSWLWGVHLHVHVKHEPSVPARQENWSSNRSQVVARHAAAYEVPQRTAAELSWQLRPVMPRHVSRLSSDSVIKSPNGICFHDNRGRRLSPAGSSSGLHRLVHGCATQQRLLWLPTPPSDLGPILTIVLYCVVIVSYFSNWVAQCISVSKHQGLTSNTGSAVEQHKGGRLVAHFASVAAGILATYLIRRNKTSYCCTDAPNVLLQSWSMPLVLAVAAVLDCQAHHTLRITRTAMRLLLAILLLLLLLPGSATSRSSSAQHAWNPLSMMMMLFVALLHLVSICLNQWLPSSSQWRSLHNSSKYGKSAAAHDTPAPADDQVETTANTKQRPSTITSPPTGPASSQDALQKPQLPQQQQPLDLATALQDEVRSQLQQCPAKEAATLHPAAQCTAGAAAQDNATAVRGYGSTAAAVSTTSSLRYSGASMFPSTATDGTMASSTIVHLPTAAANLLAAPKAATAESCLHGAGVSDASNASGKTVNKFVMYQSTLQHHMLSIKVEMPDTHDSCDFAHSLIQQLSETAALGRTATVTPPPAAAVRAAPMLLMSSPLVVRGCFHILLSVATPAAAAKGVEGVLSSTGVQQLISQLPPGSKVKMLSQHADLAADPAAAAVDASSGTCDMMLVQIDQQQPVLITKQLGRSWKVHEHRDADSSTGGVVSASQGSADTNMVTGCWVEPPYVLLPQTAALPAAGLSSSSGSGSRKLSVVARGLPAAAGPAVRAVIVQGQRILADVTVHLIDERSSRRDSDSKGLVARIELPSAKMLPGPAHLYLMAPSTQSSNPTATATAAAPRGPLAAASVAKAPPAATAAEHLGSANATAFSNARAIWACLPFLVAASPAAAADFDMLFNSMCAEGRTQQCSAATPPAVKSSDSIWARVYQQHWQPMLWDWHYAAHARDISCVDSIPAMADVLTQYPALTAADVSRLPRTSSTEGKDTASSDCKDTGAALAAARWELGSRVLQLFTDCGLREAVLQVESQLGKLLASQCSGNPGSLAAGFNLSCSDRQLLGMSVFGASSSGSKAAGDTSAAVGKGVMSKLGTGAVLDHSAAAAATFSTAAAPTPAPTGSADWHSTAATVESSHQEGLLKLHAHASCHDRQQQHHRVSHTAHKAFSAAAAAVPVSASMYSPNTSSGGGYNLPDIAATVDSTPDTSNSILTASAHMINSQCDTEQGVVPGASAGMQMAGVCSSAPLAETARQDGAAAARVGTLGSSSNRVSERVQPLSALPRVFCSQQQPCQQVIPEMRSSFSSNCSDPFMNRSFSIINSAELEAVRAVKNPGADPNAFLNLTAGVRSLQFTGRGSMPLPGLTMPSPPPRCASAAAGAAAGASPSGASFSGVQNQMSLLGLTSPLRSGQQMQLHRMQLQVGNAPQRGGALPPGSLPPSGSSSTSRPVLQFVNCNSLANLHYDLPQQKFGAAHAICRRSYDVPSQLMDMQRRMSLDVPNHLTAASSAHPTTAAAAANNPARVAGSPLCLTPEAAGRAAAVAAAAVLAGQALAAADLAGSINAAAAATGATVGAAAGAATALLAHHTDAAADHAMMARCTLPPQSRNLVPAALGEGSSDNLPQRDVLSSSTSSSPFFTAAGNLLSNITIDSFPQDLTDTIPLEQGLPKPLVKATAQQDQQPAGVPFPAPAATATPADTTDYVAKATALYDKPQATACLTPPADPAAAAATANTWTQQQGALTIAGHAAAAASPAASSSARGSGACLPPAAAAAVPPAASDVSAAGSGDQKWHLLYDDTAAFDSPERCTAGISTSRQHTMAINSTTWFAIPTNSAATLLPPPTPGGPGRRSGALYHHSTTRNTPYTPGPSARKKRTPGHSSSSGYHAGCSENVIHGHYSDNHTVSHAWEGGHHTLTTAGNLLTPQQTAAAAAHGRTPNTVSKDGTPRHSVVQHAGHAATSAPDHLTCSPSMTQSRPQPATQRKLMLFSPVRNTRASTAERKAADSLKNLGALGLQQQQQQNAAAACESTGAGGAADTVAVAATATPAATTAADSLIQGFSNLRLGGPSITSSQVQAPPAAVHPPANCRLPSKGSSSLAAATSQLLTARTPARPPLPAAAATPRHAAITAWAAGNAPAPLSSSAAAGYSTPGRCTIGSNTPSRRQTPASPMAAPGMFESWASHLLTPKNRNRDTVSGVLELLSGQESSAGPDGAIDNDCQAQGLGSHGAFGPRAVVSSPDFSDSSDEEIGPSRFHSTAAIRGTPMSATPLRASAAYSTSARTPKPHIGFFTGGPASASHLQLTNATPSSRARFAFSPYVPKPSPYVPKPSPYASGTMNKPVVAMPRIPSSQIGESVEYNIGCDEPPQSPITQAGRRITGALFAPDDEAIATGLGLTDMSNIFSGGHSISESAQHESWHQPSAQMRPPAAAGAAASGYSTPPGSPPVGISRMTNHVTGMITGSTTSSEGQQGLMQATWPGTMVSTDPISYSTPVGSPTDDSPLGTPPDQIMCSLDNVYHTAVHEASSPSSHFQDLESPVPAESGHALRTIEESPGGKVGANLTVPDPRPTETLLSNGALRYRTFSSPSLLGLQRRAEDMFQGVPSSSTAGASLVNILKPRRASAPEIQLTPPPAPARPLPSVVLVPACEIVVSEALSSAAYYDSEGDDGEWLEE